MKWQITKLETPVLHPKDSSAFLEPSRNCPCVCVCGSPCPSFYKQKTTHITHTYYTHLSVLTACPENLFSVSTCASKFSSAGLQSMKVSGLHNLCHHSSVSEQVDCTYSFAIKIMLQGISSDIHL